MISYTPQAVAFKEITFNKRVQLQKILLELL